MQLGASCVACERVWDFSGGSGLACVPGLRYSCPRHQILLGMEWQLLHSKPAAIQLSMSAEAVWRGSVHAYYGVPRGLMTTIHNGSSPEDFSPERRQMMRMEARAEFGYGNGDVVALIAANELARKGFDVLVEAQARLGDQRLQVLLVGRKPLSPAHKRRLVEFGVADSVRYAGSRIGHGGRPMHAAADLFVFPTQYEAFASSIIEALASGLPVITTKARGAGDRMWKAQWSVRRPGSSDEPDRFVASGD